ncbi:MAG: cytochrome c biosis protein CcmG, thiol:disulfide interchange protein DsbE [Blastocatellia bacterium]|jgi:cytochrome c biogenesis protein CcmG/thiol:disulfide interchange protein DsbE|nr:cytochrome c biosis protein CcmG, thiol:disulfide interchange protein DsbE [Blastocatellia bacterium]MDX6575391.1 cytochrome c biosis protein CcmG, thiol:disulfide interchange protein DsbE [Blastocatellia bacterium]
MNRLLLLPLVLFIGLVAFLLVGLRRDPHEIPSPLINKPAPAFQLKQLQDPTKTFSAAEMQGKVWLLNFWGTWCVACRDEHPLLVQYSKTAAVPIYGVDYKDERATALQLLEEEGNPYTLTASDPEGRLSIDYGVYGAPETFLIDRNGVIRYKQIGPITEEAWQKEILPRVKQLNQ